jgi:hypothetical protein
MRRTFLVLTLVAVALGFQMCSADAPAPTPPGGSGSGSGSNGNSALQVRLFTNNANPISGLCSTIQAVVTLNGANVPDGTGVIFSTDFGVFQQNGLPVVSVVTSNGTAVTALCSTLVGVSKVKATATVGSNTASATIGISFQPSAQAVPFFAFCNPNNGPNTGGTSLTMTGGRFFGDATTTRVQFTTLGITREGVVQAVTATTLTVLTPAFPEATSPSVPVDIAVTFGTNTGAPITIAVPNCFVYGTSTGGQPTITAVLPSSGSNDGGTRVTIIGSGFVPPVQVFFGPVEAPPPVSVTFNQIVVLAPAAAGAGAPNLNQTVPIRVHEVTSGVDSNTSVTFRFTPQVQIIAFSGVNVQPFNGPFTPITILGQGFEAPVAVSLAGWVATIISVSATEIVVLPGPASPPSCNDLTGPMTVTNVNTGNTGSGQTFTYLVKGVSPFITGVSGSGGGSGSVNVLISGGNFFSIASVTIGGKAASFTVNSLGQISANVQGISSPVCPANVSAGTLVSVGDCDGSWRAGAAVRGAADADPDALISSGNRGPSFLGRPACDHG